MYMLRRVPKRGDFVEYAGYRFEVTNMDGFHIDQVLMRRADHHVKHADKAEKVEKAPEGGADASAADRSIRAARSDGRRSPYCGPLRA